VSRHDDVGVEVVVEHVGAPGKERSTLLRLGWSRQDPLAVTLTLRGVPDHPALFRGSWIVLRDFLRYGLEEPTGDGDVRLHPDGAGDVVRVQLGGGGGRPTELSLPCPTVRGFLAATEAIVPSGTEGSDAAIEALIDRLLSR
jgi:hypothetical protein